MQRDPLTYVYTATHRVTFDYRQPPQAEGEQVDLIDGSFLTKREDCPAPTVASVLAEGFGERPWQRLAGVIGLATLFAAIVWGWP